MSEELVKESIEGEREEWRDTRAKWLILHLQHTKQSKCESAFLPLYLFVRRTERKEGRNKVVNCQLLPGLTKILVSSLITFISRLHVVLCDSLSNQTFGTPLYSAAFGEAVF